GASAEPSPVSPAATPLQQRRGECAARYLRVGASGQVGTTEIGDCNGTCDAQPIRAFPPTYTCRGTNSRSPGCQSNSSKSALAPGRHGLPRPTAAVGAVLAKATARGSDPVTCAAVATPRFRVCTDPARKPVARWRSAPSVVSSTSPPTLEISPS